MRGEDLSSPRLEGKEGPIVRVLPRMIEIYEKRNRNEIISDKIRSCLYVHMYEQEHQQASPVVE
jgi:hypothetical protein